VSGIDLVDRNRAVTKAERHLTARGGQPFTPFDWSAVRAAKTDEQIKGMAPDPGFADIYLQAANGNPEAQAAYLADVQKREFVETDGLSAHGMTIGKSGETVAVRMDDGSVVTLDPQNKEHTEFLQQLQADAVQAQTELETREGATSETIKEFESRFGDQLQVERMQMQTLSELTKSGVITLEQEADAIAAAQEINKALTGEGEVNVQGIASLTTDEKTGAIRMAARIAEGVEPTVVVEEVAESWYKKALVEGQLDPAELTAHRRKWHEQEGEADPVANGKVTSQRADIEWFSKRVIDYALANRKTKLPGGWGKWLRALGERLKAILRGAARMKKLLREGKVDPQLEAWFQQALGAQAEQSPAKQVPMKGEQGGLMSTFNLEGQKRAKLGGEIGANGEWYEGGRSNVSRFRGLEFGAEPLRGLCGQTSRIVRTRDANGRAFLDFLLCDDGTGLAINQRANPRFRVVALGRDLVGCDLCALLQHHVNLGQKYPRNVLGNLAAL